MRAHMRPVGVLLLAVGAAWLSYSYLDSVREGNRLWIFGSKKKLSAKLGSTVAGSVLVVNPTTSDITVKTSPGCGCETLSPTEFKLAGLASQRVHYSIDTAGSAPGNHNKGFGLLCSTKGHHWNEPITVRIGIAPEEDRNE